MTSGAAAALSHATAACIAGTDPELMQQLPDLTGLRDEVIMPRESRNVYDHAFRSWGARVIEVDTVEAFHAALGPRTAMVAVLGTGEARGAVAAGGDRRGGSQSGCARHRRCCRGTSSPTRSVPDARSRPGGLQRWEDDARASVRRPSARAQGSRVGGVHERRSSSCGRPDDEGGEGRDHRDAGGGRSAHEPRDRRGLPPVDVIPPGHQRHRDARCPAFARRCTSPLAPVRFRL